MQPPVVFPPSQKYGQENAMSNIEYLVATKTMGMQGQSLDSPSAKILVIALIAVLLGLMVLVFIRTSSKHSSHR